MLVTADLWKTFYRSPKSYHILLWAGASRQHIITEYITLFNELYPWMMCAWCCNGTVTLIFVFHRSSINQDWSWRLYISVGNQPFYLQASFYYSNVFTVLIQLGTAASLLPLACHCRYKLYKLEIICHVYSKRQLRSWFPVRLCLCIRLILPQSSGL